MASNRYSSDVHLLPIHSPNLDRHTIPRKSIATLRSPPYEPHHRERALPEVWESGENEIAPRLWPRLPRSLHRRGSVSHYVIVGDLMLTLTPLVFLGERPAFRYNWLLTKSIALSLLSELISLLTVFAACALSLNGKPLSAYGSHIIDASKLGPTIFPIIFAAIVGRLLRSAARWRAEHGTNLGLLEQLIGSQNIAGAVERIVTLRRFNVVGFAIVLLWGLSPLGGQSSLRILSTMNSTVAGVQQLYYLDTSNTAYSMLDGADDVDYFGPAINALYGACLLAPESVKNSARDLWSNVKIPLLDALSSDKSSINPWVTINHTTNTTYASLTGLMIAGLPSEGTSNFTLETQYLDFMCSNGSLVPEDALNATLEGKITYHNLSNLFSDLRAADLGPSNSFFIDTNTKDTDLITYREYPNLVYGSNNGDIGDTWLFNCTIGTTRVEANVICNADLCFVHRMRHSEKDKRPSIVSDFATDPTTFVNLILFFPWTTGVLHDAVFAPTDLYMQGSTSPYEAGYNIVSGFANVTGKMFSHRLSTLINTFWQAALAPTTTAITPSNNFSIYADSSNILASPFAAKPTIADTARAIVIYKASRVWNALLLVITLMLQFCAIAGLYLKYKATVPDILGYVSSLTRDNPYTIVPEGGNTLDGLERARLLHNLKVQVGDVKWEEEKGHIAFKTVESAGELRTGRVSKQRMYF